ncbi:hypothetical protein SDC9_174051 [bioreactor metagenome]|uniref:Uncharacterized protein n=1 Tax=bioreactor metagenome TaxID=1076179 RepID=A0A645GK77_9ZZZZ
MEEAVHADILRNRYAAAPGFLRFEVFRGEAEGVDHHAYVIRISAL